MATAGAIRMGQAFVELFTDKRKLVSGLKSAEKDMQGFGSKMRSIGSRLSFGGSVGGILGQGLEFLSSPGGILTGMGLAAKSFATAGSELNDMSARTGASVEALSLLKFAAEQTGADFAAVGIGVKGLDNKLADAVGGNKAAQASFAQLGLSAQSLLGMSVEDQFVAIADGLDRIKNPALRASAAQDIFGKSGMALLPMLKDGGAALKGTFARGMEVGAGWTTEMATSADNLGDRFDEMKTAGLSVSYAIGGALAPAIMELSEPIFAIAAGTREWIAANPGVIQSVAMVAAGVGAAGVALAGLGVAVSTVGMGLGALGATVSFIASPIGLLTAAVGTMGYVIATETNIGRDAFDALATTATTAWGGISDAVSSGDLALAGEIAMAGLNVVWQSGLSLIKDEWTLVSTYILTVWNDTTAYMATIGENAVAAMSSMWVDIKGIAFDAMNGIAAKWDQVSGGLADLIIDAGVSAGFMKGDAEEIKKARREDTARRQTTRESAGATARDTREKQKAEIEANRVAGIGGIQTEQQKQAEALGEGQDSALIASAKAKTDAEQKLAALRAKAGEKAVSVAKDRKTKAKQVGDANAEALNMEKMASHPGEITASGIAASMNRAVAFDFGGLTTPDMSTAVTGGTSPGLSAATAETKDEVLLSKISDTLDSIDQRVAAGGALTA